MSGMGAGAGTDREIVQNRGSRGGSAGRGSPDGAPTAIASAARAAASVSAGHSGRGAAEEPSRGGPAVCAQSVADDGDLEIDSGATERANRAIAVGRHNWTFVGSTEGGPTAAVRASFVASCLRTGCGAVCVVPRSTLADRPPSQHCFLRNTRKTDSLRRCRPSCSSPRWSRASAAFALWTNCFPAVGLKRWSNVSPLSRACPTSLRAGVHSRLRFVGRLPPAGSQPIWERPVYEAFHASLCIKRKLRRIPPCGNFWSCGCACCPCMPTISVFGWSLV
jgi:hypothetical protein